MDDRERFSDLKYGAIELTACTAIVSGSKKRARRCCHDTRAGPCAVGAILLLAEAVQHCEAGTFSLLLNFVNNTVSARTTIERSAIDRACGIEVEQGGFGVSSIGAIAETTECVE